VRAARGFGLGVTVCAVLAVLWPLLCARPDSFPLSTYPMFASDRGQPELSNARGLRADGSRVALPPELFGTSEVMQARSLVSRAVASGKRSSLQLCKQLAAQIDGNKQFDGVTSVELTRDRYDSIKYFTESNAPLASKRVARCDVQPKEPNP
jgi:hypothetical protein